jgi:hypothetical protein
MFLSQDSEMVKVVNVGASGSVFAFPAGEVLVEKGNTAQDTFGVVSCLSFSPPHLKC